MPGPTELPIVSADRDRRLQLRRWLLPWIPVATALAYPWTLGLFHIAVTSARSSVIATLAMLLVFGLPLSCLFIAHRCQNNLAGRGNALCRLAYAALAAPPLFVLAGVLSGLAHAPVRDVWVWSACWVTLAIFAGAWNQSTRSAKILREGARLRVLHGISGSVILLFVAFHLSNHLAGLLGPDVHARIMLMGRSVYRSHLVEPLLIAALLWQVASGTALAWRWTKQRLDFPKVVQIGSGAYLAAFILTHLNSALVSARWVHGIPTDWAWASGAPEGLLLDAWNVRLVPHYALGVCFVITHLFSGLRTVLIAHSVQLSTANRILAAGMMLAAGISTAIVAALCGLRL